jgi:hypothetical protein
MQFLAKNKGVYMYKDILLALIKGLTTYKGSSQYDKGTPCIEGKNLEILIVLFCFF